MLRTGVPGCTWGVGNWRGKGPICILNHACSNSFQEVSFNLARRPHLFYFNVCVKNSLIVQFFIIIYSLPLILLKNLFFWMHRLCLDTLGCNSILWQVTGDRERSEELDEASYTPTPFGHWTGHCNFQFWIESAHFQVLVTKPFCTRKKWVHSATHTSLFTQPTLALSLWLTLMRYIRFVRHIAFESNQAASKTCSPVVGYKA